APYTSHVVEPDSGWIDDRTWRGVFWVQSDTGDGMNTVRISSAVDSSGFQLPEDLSHRFEIDTDEPGTANNGIAVASGTDTIKLYWPGPSRKGTTHLGFNIRRSLTAEPGSWVRINPVTVIEEEYTDSGLNPGTAY